MKVDVKGIGRAGVLGCEERARQVLCIKLRWGMTRVQVKELRRGNC